jgi:hypothetical protein
MPKKTRSNIEPTRTWKDYINSAPKFTGTKFTITKILESGEKHIAWHVHTKKGNVNSIESLGVNMYDYGEPMEFSPSFAPIYAKDLSPNLKKRLESILNTAKKNG